MSYQPALSSISSKPPSENTIENNVTHEIIKRWTSSTSGVTAISPTRKEEGKKFGYDMLPDPGQSGPVAPQITIAIQFKSLKRKKGSNQYEFSGIGSYNSGKYLKIKIDSEQLSDIQNRNQNIKYSTEELFYAIPLPAKRFREPGYLSWVMFVDAFDLPPKTTRIYIPPYYCPGAFTQELTKNDVSQFAQKNGTMSNLSQGSFSGSKPIGAHWHSAKYPAHHWKELDAFAQSLYDITAPSALSTTLYSDRLSAAINTQSGSPMPRTYGVYAGGKNTDRELIMPHVYRWNEIQQGLSRGRPGFGRTVTRGVTPDGGGPNTDDTYGNILVPPSGWTLFVETPLND